MQTLRRHQGVPVIARPSLAAWQQLRGTVRPFCELPQDIMRSGPPGGPTDTAICTMAQEGAAKIPLLGRRVLPGKWILLPGRRILLPGKWILPSGQWVLPPGRWILSSGRRDLPSGQWILPSGEVGSPSWEVGSHPREMGTTTSRLMKRPLGDKMKPPRPAPFFSLQTEPCPWGAIGFPIK